METNEKSYPLSVIIPIHRSGLDIIRCLESLLENSFLRLQIIVAANSDESAELQKLNSIIPHWPCITVINIHKAGKSNAINEAIRHVRNEIVLIGDADTVFLSQGLNSCLERITADKTVIAITGIVDPIKNNTLTAIQKFEYRRVFRIFRPFWDIFNANLLISGCAGVFRTEALLHVGLYDCKTFGEDFEITLRLHEYHLRYGIPYKIVYVNRTVAQTDVPGSFYDLIRQRGRWFAGQVEVLWKYRFLLLQPGRYRMIIVPYLLSVLFEVLGTILKWPVFTAVLRCCIVRNLPLFSILLISESCFLLLECLFNVCTVRKTKVKKAAVAVKMTLRLIVIQSILKDTNVFCLLPLLLKKDRAWLGMSQRKRMSG